MSLSIGSARRLGLDDVVKVAVSRVPVVIDDAAIEKLDKDYSTALPKEPLAEPSSESSTSSLKSGEYSEEDIRAGLFYRAVSLLQGKSPVRSVVVLRILDLLNLGLTPILTSDSTAGSELQNILNGNGFCYDATGGKVDIADAFKAANIQPHSLSVTEQHAFIGYPFITVGASCLLAAGFKAIAKQIDCVAALSCEAAGCRNEPFDATNFETNRQHRGQMLSCSNLRMMLEGSKRINSDPAISTAAAELYSFYSIPQVNGPCLDMMTTICKAAEIELNSSEGDSNQLSTVLPYNATQSVVAIEVMSAAFDKLITASQDRCAFLSKGGEQNALKQDAGVSSSDDLIIKTHTQLSRLSECMANELYASLQSLQHLDSVAEASARMKELKAAENEKKNLKPENDDKEANYTPEQRAKAEAKRKAKAEKAMAKAAAKKSTTGVVLGAGSVMIREFITSTQSTSSADSSSTTTTTTTIPSLSELCTLVNPFDIRENSFAAYCTQVLEKLNAGGKRRPKIPKGTRDYVPEQMRIREQVFGAIRRVFKRHGGVEIDTPVFELKEILTGKYGEDSKLIYDLADQGGELLSLRYDLTVPFARFLAMNSVGNIKRYHMAKVYRRDQPQLNRGRYREFYQCDFDIAGAYSLMVPDAEVITVATEILSDLPVGPFLIKLNHRKLLDAIFEISGVPAEKFRPICSAVDKLDKATWEEVKTEMVEEKGLDPAAADRIGTFVLHKGSPQVLWKEMQDKKIFGDHVGANAAMDELKLLFSYLEAMGSLPYVSFDMSLARGLDYYTGVIYEAVLTTTSSDSGAAVVSVGSIAAGGRYDNLVGMFSPTSIQTPCVGVSIGIERVFTIMERRAEQLSIPLQSGSIQVFVASIGAGLVPERMRIAQILWQNNISAEYSHQDNPKFKKQLDEALERGIPYMVVFGQEELDKKVVKLKDMQKHTEIEVPLQSASFADSTSPLIGALLSAGCTPIGSGGGDFGLLDAIRGGGSKEGSLPTPPPNTDASPSNTSSST